ncbi:hypothetical protein FRC12_006863 [Ceratobasidium sp. 428]|nr:hypothetical protein FRC12_006863 [Ceratobasidium sp. 428]
MQRSTRPGPVGESCLTCRRRLLSSIFKGVKNVTRPDQRVRDARSEDSCVKGTTYPLWIPRAQV